MKLRKPSCPPQGLSWRHADQEDSALRTENVGQAQCPRMMGGGRGQTELPLPAPEASGALLLDLGEGEIPALPPTPKCAPRPPPSSFSGYQRPRLVSPT